VEAPPGAPFDHGRFDIVLERAGATGGEPPRRRLPVAL
jgi:hypothetical protein